MMALLQPTIIRVFLMLWNQIKSMRRIYYMFNWKSIEGWEKCPNELAHKVVESGVLMTCHHKVLDHINYVKLAFIMTKRYFKYPFIGRRYTRWTIVFLLHIVRIVCTNTKALSIYECRNFTIYIIYSGSLI